MSKKNLEKNYGEVLWTGKKCRLGLPISLTRYIITTKKLYAKIGFFNIKEDQVELYRIIDFSLSLPLGQRICGCGTVKFFAKDKTMPEYELKSVKNPRNALSILENAVESERKKYKIHGRDMVGNISITENIDDCDNCDTEIY